jgi:hypothetical protein
MYVHTFNKIRQKRGMVRQDSIEKKICFLGVHQQKSCNYISDVVTKQVKTKEV